MLRTTLRTTESRRTRRAALLSLTVLALTAAAQARPGPLRPAQTELDGGTAEDARALKRIFVLEGGTTLRTIGRRVNGAWQIKRDGEWSALPWPIARVRLEREVLAELRELSSKLARDAGGAQHCELAEWMFRNGLLAEALGELDDWITVSDCAARVLAGNAFRFSLPGPLPQAADARTALEPVLEYGTRSTPALQELCTLRLRGHGDEQGVRATLAADLAAANPARRAWSAFALGRLYPGDELQALLQRAVLDASDDVRRRAQDALRQADEPAVLLPVQRALAGSTSARVRVQAAQALGQMGYPAAVPSLIARLAVLEGGGAGRVPHSNIFVGRQIAYLQDFDVEVAQSQSVADPNVNVLLSGQVTDAGVVGVKRVEVSVERQIVRDSLERLTAERVGRTSAEWSAWWEAHGSRLLAGGE